MSQAIALRGNQNPYSFERWPEEAQEEYDLFRRYCEIAGPVTPYDFLTSIGAPMEMVDLATLRGWVYRRDAYHNWLDKQRRQAALQVVDKYLVVLAKRLPYLEQREEFARRLENLDDPDPKKTRELRPGLKRSYTQATKDLHDTLHELLRVAKALEPGTGININTMISNAPQESRKSIEEMAKDFGDPFTIIDPAKK